MSDRPTVVILHGANGSGPIMQPFADVLSSCADTFTPNMLGHGGRPVPPRLRIADQARDMVEYLDANAIAQTFLFGYSSGALTACYLARHYPARVLGVATLAAKYVFDRKTVEHWTHVAEVKRLSRPGNKRAAELAETHRPQNWQDVTNSIREMFFSFEHEPPLSEDDLRSIAQPALIVSSDEDQIVSLEETIALGNLLPNARVVLFKGQSHPFHIVPIEALGKATCSWIAEVQSGATVTER